MQSVDQVQLGTDQPVTTRLGGAHGLEDGFRGADIVGFLANLEAVLGVTDDKPLRVLFAEAVDMTRLKHLVHRAKALPENHLGVLDLLRRQPAHGQHEVPDDHVLQRNAHVVTGIAPQMLVGEKQHLLASRKGPVQHAAGIR